MDTEFYSDSYGKNGAARVDLQVMKSFPLYRWLGLFFLLNLIILNFLRANTISITHDEAFTFNRFVSQGWKEIIFVFHSNNHILNSLLMKLSISFFGLSNLSMRLPALIGGIVYLFSVESICFVFFKNKMRYYLTLMLMSVSPFIMDYLIVGRGYGLSLGLLFLGLSIFSIRNFPDDHYQGSRSTHFQLAFLSVLFGLSISANLSFLIINLSALAAIGIFETYKFFRHKCQRSKLMDLFLRYLLLVIPGAGSFVIINPAIFNFDPADMYYGSDTWLESIASLINATFSNFDLTHIGQMRIDRLFNLEYVAGLIFIFLFLGILGIIIALWKNQDLYDLESGHKMLIFFYLILFISILIFSIFNLSFNILLPKDRTGLFFIPIVALLIGLSAETYPSILLRKMVQILSYLSMLGIVLYFFGVNDISYFRGRKYDSSSRMIYEELRTLRYEIDDRGVGINWLFEPSLNYYRHYYHDDDLPIFTRNNPNAQQSVFVLLPEQFEADQNFLIENSIQIYYRDSQSGAVIGIK